MVSAVSSHLLSDVPLGVFLSGGLDSGSIVATMHELGVHPIRTFTIAHGRTTLGVGGGIVADSDPEREWDETCLKARRLLRATGAAEPEPISAPDVRVPV